MSWRREAEPDAAAGRILDAAEKAFAEIGVSAASMGRIAEQAGCSRGTLYRYFPDRHALHLAYVHRAARRIVRRVGERTAGIADPRGRLVEGILGAVAEVRGDPATAAWFEPGASGIAARMSRGDEVIEALMEAFVADLFRPSDPLRAGWLVRVVVSLLSMPGNDAADERALVERFVVPGLGELR
ncbi:MAG: TetR/AcrR family transcriptional regulator [Myxococcota bacterium]